MKLGPTEISSYIEELDDLYSRLNRDRNRDAKPTIIINAYLLFFFYDLKYFKLWDITRGLKCTF